MTKTPSALRLVERLSTPDVHMRGVMVQMELRVWAKSLSVKGHFSDQFLRLPRLSRRRCGRWLPLYPYVVPASIRPSHFSFLLRSVVHMAVHRDVTYQVSKRLGGIPSRMPCINAEPECGVYRTVGQWPCAQPRARSRGTAQLDAAC